MPFVFFPAVRRFAMLIGATGVLLAAGCAGTSQADRVLADEVSMLYGGIADGEYYIGPVDPGYITPQTRRQSVSYFGPEAPGTLVVDPFARVLYHVQDLGTAVRYGIAVGKEGLGFQGDATIGRKAEWPAWQPTRNMIRTQPETYAQYADGLPGGLENPLGARALYLYRGPRDTLYRIHGTNSSSSIGQATSAGCIRLYNQDIIHLYEQIEPGTAVHVRTLEESIALEGPTLETPNGFAISANGLDADELAELSLPIYLN